MKPARAGARRIAMFLPSLHGGGAERVLLDLAAEFVQGGFDVDLVMMKAYDSPLSILVPDAVRRVDLDCPRYWTSTRAFARYLRERRPDAVLAAMPLANAVAACARVLARATPRLVLSEHNAHSLVFGDVANLRDRVLAPLVRRAYPSADCIVAVSEGVAARLREVPGVSADKVRVVYNPAWSPRIEALAREPVPHAWLDNASIPVVLGSGRLEAQKDFATLLRAFALLRARRPARLMILGEGTERQRLEKLASELGVGADVAFPGFVMNPWAYVARARVFALSSVHEGLPGVLIESLACGTPVVSTDCPSGPSEILEAGRYGALVPVRDPEALAAAVERALDDPAPPELLRQRARRFSIDVAAAGYLDALGLGQ